MFDYAHIKFFHIGCVTISISGFTLRGGLMLADSPLLWHRWVRTVPHIVDTALLVSGLWLATIIGQYPGTAGWLTAKLVALLLYIGLGFVALRLGRSKPVRIAALLGALTCFGYMIAVAVTKSALPFF
jgi:uncharacterized membrane protein SirB2